MGSDLTVLRGYPLVAALYWPKIARIVPAGYPVADDPVTRALIEELDFIIDISPDSGKAKAGELVMVALVSGGSRLHDEFKVYSAPLERAQLRNYRLAADN